MSDNIELFNSMMDRITSLRETRAVKQKGGKMYTMIQDRVETFRRLTGDMYRISTEIIEWDKNPGGLIVVKAIITNSDGYAIAMGHAEEVRGSNYINETSALENAETSAVGRALAVFGIHGGEFASADEIGIAMNKRDKMADLKDAKPLSIPALATKPETPKPADKAIKASPVEKSSPDIKYQEPRQLDIVEAVEAAGGKCDQGHLDHPIMQNLRPEIASTVISVHDKTPVIARTVQDYALLEEVFFTFIPLCETVDECYSFWTKNEALIQMMKAGDREAYDRVLKVFTARKGKIQEAKKK